MDRLMPSRTTVHLVFVFVLQFGTTLQQQQQSSSQLQAPLPIEWFALIHLRTSLGIRANEWPIKLNPCTDWKGVQCRNGSVVGINISGFRRTRFVKPNPKFDVPALQNLTRLELFNASFFPLPGRIPDLFGQSLRKLQVLDLHSCSITGTIPFNFGNLSSLSTLILSVNDLTGEIPPSLDQLRNLSVLDLSQNSLTGSIPLTFSSLQNLSVLDISSNFLSGSIPPSIGTILGLTRLNLSGNSLSSSIPPQLGDLASLVDLDLSLNSLRGSLSLELRRLKSLQKMVIGHNRLSGALTNDLFIGLARLEFVDLSWNNFSGFVPHALLSKPSLSFLDVSRNNLTGTLPNTFFTHHITTAVLNLSQNLYYGELTSVLQRFSSVDLSGNYFEGKVPGYAQINSSLSSNCLQNVTKQRTLQDCSSFYHTRGLVFDNFGGTSTTAPAPAPHPAKNSHRQTIILAATLGGVGILILLFLLLLLYLRNRRMGASHPRGNGVGPIPTAAAPPSPGFSINFASLGNAFTYQQLLQATGEFNDANFIKHGHSGDFYRGVMEGGTLVVIKKVDLVSVKKEAYLLELDFLSKVSHPRLVPLLGYCLEKENEKYLVYKYMPNGDLSSSFYRKVNTGDDGLQSLDWITRLKIATGTAEGLSYLHHECAPPFVHRDVQASSILLDDKYEVRLGSLSEVCNQEGDGHQSVISRFLRLQQTSEPGPSGSQTTCAYDVYCFGKVLLELVTGKLGISASNDASVKAWLDQTLPCINIYDKELVTKIVDPSLIVDEDLLEEVWAMAVVARSCLNPKPSRRPLMRYILRALENPLKVVREENTGSARLRTASSRGSWNAALFGSWRQSSDVAAGGPSYTTTRTEGGAGSFRRSATSGSQGSDHNGGGGDHSSSQRRQSREIVPEPSGVHDIERQGED